MTEKMRNELISRGAMLVLAALLLAGGWKLGKTAYWLDDEQAKERAERRDVGRSSFDRRQRAFTGYFWTGSALLLAGGLFVAVYAVVPSKYQRIPMSRPPSLWENPDPPVHRWH